MTAERQFSLVRRSLLACLALPAGAVRAAVTASALDRPALPVRDAPRSVLSAAAMAGERVVAVGERGLVLLSNDAARTWRQAAVPVSVTLTAVRFADPLRGYATGHGGVLLRTDDGGERWHRVLDGRTMAQAARAAAGADAAALKRAEQLVRDGPDKPLLDLWVVDASRVVVIGAYGLAFETTDAGATWTSWGDRLPNPKGLHLYAIRRQGDTVAIAGEQGLVLRSTDGGASFTRLALPYAGSFFTLELPTAKRTVVAGLRGNVWECADEASPWTACPTPAPASITASVLRADGSLLLANQAGMVLAGPAERLTALALPALPPLNGVLPLAGDALLTLSAQGAAVVSLAEPRR